MARSSRILKAAFAQTGEASTHPEDDDLVKAAFDDPAALASLYRRYASRVYRYAYACVGDQEEAQDLTAQVFIEMLESLHRYRPQGKFVAWLFTIARRRAIDFGRRARVQYSLGDLEELPSPENNPQDEVIRKEKLRRLVGLLDKLDDREKELVHLRFAAGMSYAQMSSVLQRSRPALRMAMHRLMRRLRRKWEEEDE